MLSACIKSESLKVRRSFVWIAFILTPLIPVILGTQNYLNNLDLLESEWYSLWRQETLFYTNFFYSPLIAVYCSYLWRLENMNKNRNTLFTAPVPIRNIVLAKWLTVGKITLITQLWVYVLYLVSGKMVSLPGLPAAATFLYTLRGLLGGMVIAALQLLLSMIIRSFAAPVAIAAIGSITGLIGANSGYGIYYPYSLLMMGMNANKAEDMLAGSSVRFFLISVFYMILFISAAVAVLKHRDVRA